MSISQLKRPINTLHKLSLLPIATCRQHIATIFREGLCFVVINAMCSQCILNDVHMMGDGPRWLIAHFDMVAVLLQKIARLNDKVAFIYCSFWAVRPSRRARSFISFIWESMLIVCRSSDSLDLRAYRQYFSI